MHESHYEINVSKKDHKTKTYVHFFTARLQASATEDVAAVYLELINQFHRPIYQLDVTYWRTVGEPMAPDDFLSPE